MSRLSAVSASPVIREFAQGAAQSAIQPVANFVAPPVDVPSSIGKYKVYTEKSRFRLPDTRRALGGRATTIQFDAADATYDCEPHALDFPIDNLERLEEAGLEDALKEGAVAVAEIAALAHEKAVVDAALAAAGAGTDKVWEPGSACTNDPVNDIDDAILSVIKAAKYGSLMGVGVLFGATAWKLFKNAYNVRGKFVVGSGKGSVGLAVPTEELAGGLFLGNPQVRTSFMVYDSAAEGIAESISFVLDSAVLIFARKDQPSRRDPSFMKTFRLMGQWMVPGSYSRDDGRVEVAKFDWSEDVIVTNSSAVVRLNPAAS